MRTESRRTKDVLLQAGSAVTSFHPILRMLDQAVDHGRIPRAVWSRIPIDTDFEVRVSRDEHFTYVATATDVLGRLLFWRGLDGWEPETTSVFAALARTARGVVDAGAHTGLYTLLACAVNPNASVYAFEPVARIAQALRLNIGRNGWAGRCSVFENPVAEADGYVPFHVPASATPMSASLNPYGLQVGPHDPAWQHAGGLVIRSYARAIDSCLDVDAPIDLIKLDIEGFEDRAIAGLPVTLNTWSPAVIFEVIDADKCAGIENIFTQSGYQFYKLTACGPEATESLRPPTVPEFRNYLAVKQESHRRAVESMSATVPDRIQKNQIRGWLS
jgi:FkbM family methyltransferase